MWAHVLSTWAGSSCTCILRDVGSSVGIIYFYLKFKVM